LLLRVSSKCVSKKLGYNRRRKDWNGTPCRGERAITKQSYLRFAHYLTRDVRFARARARSRRKILHKWERGKIYAITLRNPSRIIRPRPRNFVQEFPSLLSALIRASDRNNYLIRATIVMKGSCEKRRVVFYALYCFAGHLLDVIKIDEFD